MLKSVSNAEVTDEVIIPPLEKSQLTLQEYAHYLARSLHQTRQEKGVNLPVLKHFDALKLALETIHRQFTRSEQDNGVIFYAREWLLDNFYIIQRALNQVEEDLPASYYAELPKLTSGLFKHLPRIYAVARAFSTQVEGNVAQLSAKEFLKSFQEKVPLTMGELWAWPTMLRLCALENLIWALEHTTRTPNFSRFLPRELRVQLLQDHAASQLLVASSVTALRLLSTHDWQKFFESVSRVEAILRRDPSGVYPHMDFETRNQYRRVIEEMSQVTDFNEETIAQTALNLALAFFTETEIEVVNSFDGYTPFTGHREAHIGYYLIDGGYEQLVSSLRYHPAHKRLTRWLLKHHPTQLYIGAMVILTLLIVSVMVTYADAVGGSIWQVILAAAVLLIPSSSIAVHLTNWVITQQTPPTRLPKLDFSEGIPSAYQTIVVIPALLSDTEELDSLIQQIELHYLRNPDPQFRFALLADYIDAPAQEMPEDEAILEHAVERITMLNNRYSSQPFYFFLRCRLWNESEGTWMGYERKRGKLAEFNRLLLDAQAETSYCVKLGNLPALAGTRYVITLDADTVMPHKAAHRLVGTLAHPLNQARFAEKSRHVTAGYTVLQPRIELLPTIKNRTGFARIMGGDTGFDLYTLAVSDIYQDLFGEGIFVGKGIYDVTAFEKSLENRVPENALLSHDLFEGIHGRAGLVTDVVLVEDYPTHYLAFTRRLHRWIRGDWQLLPWLMPRVPVAGGAYVQNTLSTLSRWKILDNIRRSLERPAILLLLIIGWLSLPGSVFVWTGFALLALWIPFVVGVVSLAKSIAANTRLTSAHDTRLSVLIIRCGLSLAFLVYESFIALDAIAKTLVRLVRRKKLLEWTSAATAMRIFNQDARSATWQQMSVSILITVSIGFLVLLINPFAMLAAFPLLVTWMLAPYIAERLSRSERPTLKSEISDDNVKQLRMLARRTWLFFEAFVGPNDHWLPPDNYQREPGDRIKHYTSPTNIGLMLLSTLAARDLGYIGLLDLMLRLRFAFDSIGQLERHRGHLLNWYQTQSLKALMPRYVSTVDSGNYAGCLLALREGYSNLLNVPALSKRRWQGLIDTIDVIDSILSQMHTSDDSAEVEHVVEVLQEMRQQISGLSNEPLQWMQLLNKLTHELSPSLNDATLRLLTQLDGRHVKAMSDLNIYLSRLNHHFFSMHRDIESLLPWLILFQNIPANLSAKEWNTLQLTVVNIPRLGDLQTVYKEVQHALDSLELSLDDNASEAKEWCREFSRALDVSKTTVQDLLADFESVQAQIDREIETMDFGFLYDKERHLFYIGYSIENEQTDANHYDLLASEARLASYIAIAKGDVPYKHWLHLGRPMNLLPSGQVLHSWSGTMFEYLMPLLLMQQEANTLLGSSTHVAVEAQMDYAAQHHTPWGISESGYYAFDIEKNYQYRAFGVPELALKRGQELDHVIAPYASILALPLCPGDVIDNLNKFIGLNALDTYGLVEAIDYTYSHLPLGKSHALVNQYMAHHQGMVFLSLTNFLYDNVMVRRFHANPKMESIELLLLEQIPPQIDKREETETEPQETIPTHVNVTPWEAPIESPFPQAYYLSNGRYAVMMTSAGSGYSKWKERALTRWRADTTLDDWGTWIYLRDNDSGDLWSAGYQPIDGVPQRLKTVFHPHKVEIIRRDYDLTTRLEVVVPPDDDVEIRRLTLTNHSEDVRHLTICSYGELVLTAQANDQRHQAFNKLFIESEYLPDLQSLIFRRRLRSEHDEPLYVLHRMLLQEGESTPQLETDRARFLGRNRTIEAPQVFDENQIALSGTTGATLDPIMALAHDLEIEPHGTIQVVYLTFAGDKRTDLIDHARLYGSWTRIDHAFDQARHVSERELQRLEIDSAAIKHIQTLYSALIYPHPTYRAPSQILAANTQAQPGLWAHGISGDFPIVLVEINSDEELELVRELIQAHTFWRNRGIQSTLVILNMHDTGYEQGLYGQLNTLITRMHSEIWLNRHDGIFILRNEQLNDESRVLLRTAARIYLNGERGTLEQQLTAHSHKHVNLPAFTPTLNPSEIETADKTITRPTGLIFDNGYGGFTPDGHEYVIYLTPEQQEFATTPAPWTNVIANENAGFIVTESGGGFSWAYNSGENRLTTWRNDPVTDTPSEALYLRDEETGTVWSPTPLPSGTDKPYCVRHGAGYSEFEHHNYGIEQTVRYYMAPIDPVKFIRIRLKNTSARPRRITITYYAEWVLGSMRDITQQYVIPTFDRESQTLTASNPYSIEFGDYHAFVTASKALHGLTTDRTEFLGRLASYQMPEGLRRIGLSGTVSAGVDPCAVVQLHVDLPVDGEDEVCFILGQGTDRAMALELSKRYCEAPAIEAAWQDSRAMWRKHLDSVIIRTPDKAMNVLHPWLLYQATSCRIWGRSALYQSSGAYGFRDQLQDVMALVHSQPEQTRAHILRAAQHQFEAGDVLHWWHPPSGRGVRTRFSDDLLWLPFVVAYYVNATGDESVLHEKVPFLKAEPLRSDEEERYGLYESTPDQYTIYEHCRRALEKGFTSGRHNLPLMKAGDWNDGMNRVGIEGRGESVWMAWFLHTTMNRFLPVCDVMQDAATKETCLARMERLQHAVEQHAWDGYWYLRAYYDDGTPLGSSQNDECKIDSLAQSWAVLSGAAQPERVEQAMNSVEQWLVKEEAALVELFTPPFNHTSHDPGYIKGYPPGIRENGGQYTHAALWVIWAMAELGRGDQAVRLFRLMNPINHSNTQEKAELYDVEPYVIAADVYSEEPHLGHGGWTWYTGSASWMYRVALEAILGLQREGAAIRIQPKISSEWPQFEVDYRYGSTLYKIRVENPDGIESGDVSISLDGQLLAGNLLPLLDDGDMHVVVATLKA